METIRVQEALRGPVLDADVVVHGWIRTVRDAKTLVFCEINDGSCLANLQAIIEKAHFAGNDELNRLGTGASIVAEGALVASQGKNQQVELQVKKFSVIGTADQETYPLQKKRHSFEYLREIAHLRPRTNTFGAVARVRNHLSQAIHGFFQQRGFFWVHTPIITASDCEGAGAMFQVTTLDLPALARRSSTAGAAPASPETLYANDFFGKSAYLTVSGQLNAEIYACALERVYTFGPTFRAENSNTARHLAEFWMVEPEVAFCDITGNMDLAEAFITTLVRSVLQECHDDIAFFDQRIQPGLIGDLQLVAETPFVRMTYSDAVNILRSSGRSFEYPVAWGTDLQSEHERFLTEVHCKSPVILTDYPKGIKAFYMRLNDDETTVRAMDVLVPRLGEIIGGSERESRLDMLDRRLDELSMDKATYWWYRDLRRYGSVPHAGFGLGFERLIQYVTGMQNIRDVIPFPRTVGNAEF